MSVDELKQMAATIRCDIIDMICTAEAGHPGGSLSATDIVTSLYFRLMRIDPANPRWPERDRFILSKGHACPVWYAALAERGFFDKSHLGTPAPAGQYPPGPPGHEQGPRHRHDGRIAGPGLVGRHRHGPGRQGSRRRTITSGSSSGMVNPRKARCGKPPWPAPSGSSAT